MTEKQYDALIVGGGVAGLTAALHLAERGLKPLILEADERIGGRLSGKACVNVKGVNFPVEHGVHGLWFSYVNLRALLQRAAIISQLTPAKDEQWIHRSGGTIRRVKIGATIRNSLIPAPFHYIQLFASPQFLAMLGWRDWLSVFNVWSVLAMSIGIDPFVEDQPLEGLTFGGALQKWGPTFRALFYGLTRNGLSTDPHQVPLAGFLAFLRFYTVLRRDAWRFDYLPNGGGEVCEKLSEKIINLGGAIRLQSRVTRVEQRDGQWIAHWNQDQTHGADSAPFILLASDSPSTESIIKSSFPAKSFFFPHGLGHAVIRLWFDTKLKNIPEAGMFSGDFVMHNFFWLDQIYDAYKRWSAETGGSCIEVHIYGPPEVLAQADALLITNVLTDIYRAYPKLKGRCIAPHLQRNADTHTLPALGARGTHLGIETPWPNLYCAGDWVRHEAPAFFLERACVTGLIAANKILESAGLEPWEVKPYPPSEPLAAWIESAMMRGRKNRRRVKSVKINS
ncbi:MAG: FAD-dependent oxidoreductase [Anaerolineales bacterium]|nr:FAD-dependent oxidoreductase [Anaerolineales bacterium]